VPQTAAPPSSCGTLKRVTPALTAIVPDKTPVGRGKGNLKKPSSLPRRNVQRRAVPFRIASRRSPSGNRYDIAGDTTRPLPTRDSATDVGVPTPILLQ
jgi:hypothetical protein